MASERVKSMEEEEIALDECAASHSTDPVTETRDLFSLFDAEEDCQGTHSGSSTQRPAVSSLGPRRARPQSAISRANAKRSERIRSHHPFEWNVSDVTAWLEQIGFQQYRKRFIHNAIDGSLLMRLTDEQLKMDVGIGPLGHRHAILNAIKYLDEDQTCTGRTRPQSAPTTMSQRKGDVYGGSIYEEHRVKLMVKIERSEIKIAERRRWIEKAARELKEEENYVANLKSELQRLDSMLSSSQASNEYALDQKGKVPWFPIGEGTFMRDPFPERLGNKRDAPSLDETFRPQINLSTTQLLESSHAGGKSFLQRLDDDIAARNQKKKLSELTLQKRGRTKITEESLKRDSDLVLTCIREMQGEELDSAGLAEYLDAQVETGDIQSQFDLDPLQVQRIERTKGSARITALAGAIRTQRFMENYRSELQSRDSNLKDLEKKWRKETLHSVESSEQLKKDAEAFLECAVQMGWNSAHVDDSMLDALIRRGLRLKEATENHQQVDWSRVKDGLPVQLDIPLPKCNSLHTFSIDLTLAVTFLSRMPSCDLQKLLELEGERKQATLYRALRSQRFLAFVDHDISNREQKVRHYWESCTPAKKILNKSQVEAFFDRLIDDGIKRQEKRQQQIQEKIQKEEQLLKEMANRTFARKFKKRIR